MKSIIQLQNNGMIQCLFSYHISNIVIAFATGRNGGSINKPKRLVCFE